MTKNEHGILSDIGAKFNEVKWSLLSDQNELKPVLISFTFR